MDLASYEQVVRDVVWNLQPRGMWGNRDDPVYEGLVDALLGKGSHSVFVADFLSDRWVVLGSCSLDSPEFTYPRLIRGIRGVSASLTERLLGTDKIRPLSTEQVRRWFILQMGGKEFSELMRGPKNIGLRIQGSMTLVSRRSFAKVPIGGDIAIYSVLRGGSHAWYDLSSVPIGGSIYRITEGNALVVFLKARQGDPSWLPFVFPKIAWAKTAGGSSVGAILVGAREILR